jgi:hypothetical protein
VEALLLVSQQTRLFLLRLEVTFGSIVVGLSDDFLVVIAKAQGDT